MYQAASKVLYNSSLCPEEMNKWYRVRRAFGSMKSEAILPPSLPTYLPTCTCMTLTTTTTEQGVGLVKLDEYTRIVT
jgi:hypothetical protein